MKTIKLLAVLCTLALPLGAAEEKPVTFIPARTDDPFIGDWQGKDGHYVAQIYLGDEGKYQANLLKQFDAESNVVAVLRGEASGGTVNFSGDGWNGTLANGRFKGGKRADTFDLKRVVRASPTVGAPPPPGAVVLFDGHTLDAWATKKGKEWLVEDGPAKWKVVEGGAMEVVPGTDCIISHRKFGDCRIHVEFRTLGTPCNSGVFIQTRYEANINETYGRIDRAANAGFDNCLPPDGKPSIRPGLPPLAWQTFDIDFRAPRFDAAGNKTEKARATVLFNGVKIYDHQELDTPHLAAGRLGEAPTGPLMLQEHGMPLQFRNIWIVEKGM